MAANQTECSKLDQRSVIKFITIEKCKLCEIYKWMCGVYKEKQVLVKNILTNGLNMSLTLWSRVKKTIEWKHTSTVKKKFQVQQSIKKVMLTMFWTWKDPSLLSKMCNCKQCFLLFTLEAKTLLSLLNDIHTLRETKWFYLFCLINR